MSFFSSLFSKPKAPKPQVIQPPSADNQDVQQAAKDAKQRAAYARGRESTILTSQGTQLGNVGA
jgi:hypothetical protein